MPVGSATEMLVTPAAREFHRSASLTSDRYLMGCGIVGAIKISLLGGAWIATGYLQFLTGFAFFRNGRPPSTVVDRLRERGLREGAPGIGSLSFSDILFFCAKSRNRKRLTPNSDGDCARHSGGGGAYETFVRGRHVSHNSVEAAHSSAVVAVVSCPILLPNGPGSSAMPH